MKLALPLQLLTHLGPRWVAFRMTYAIRRRTGALERSSPAADWYMVPAPAESTRLEALFSEPPMPGEGCVVEAEEILLGCFRLFSKPAMAAGFPPRWNRNQITGEEAPVDVHWSRLGDFSFGDIKGIWELSRFSWAFPLARAYARTGQDRYAEGFWQLFESWCEHARPNCGPNWMCGQEAAFRLMAATFARVVCKSAPATTAARIEQFRRFACATGYRIAANLNYALSQSNNHGISECVALITAGTLLPTAPHAPAWLRTGIGALEQQVAALVYFDGGFAQHSANYHRVLLHDLLWCAAVLQSWNEAPPVWLTKAGRRAVQLAGRIVIAETGRVPLYGSNDGANVLPLADADYLDFRPVVQAAAVVFEGNVRLAPGPWDEMAAWMSGRKSLSSVGGPKERESPLAEDRVLFAESGCLHWQRGSAKLFLRCPARFRHRPSQADMMHVDLAWRGQPIAIDAGTYSYHTTGKFAGALKDAAVHNTVTLDGLEPMRTVGRFLYMPWPRGHADWSEEGKAFSATHDGWSRYGLSHRRTLRTLADDQFEVVDEVAGLGSHRVRVHWLLADWPYRLDPAERRLVLETPVGNFVVSWDAADARVTLVRGDETSSRGWWSPLYSHVVPALSLAIEFMFSGSGRCVTRFAPEA